MKGQHKHRQNEKLLDAEEFDEEYGGHLQALLTSPVGYQSSTMSEKFEKAFEEGKSRERTLKAQANNVICSTH